jgi:large conductance mechanosensitive channel
MSMIQEFKKFALRGNVIDMAVGIIIGAAFSGVVKSLVDDVIMPPIGVLTGGIDFKELSYPIKDAVTEMVDGVPQTTPAVTLNYGNFINSSITFLIVAWAVFMLIKAINAAESRLSRGETPPADAPPPPENIVLLRQIRDALQSRA